MVRSFAVETDIFLDILDNKDSSGNIIAHCVGILIVPTCKIVARTSRFAQAKAKR